MYGKFKFCFLELSEGFFFFFKKIFSIFVWTCRYGRLTTLLAWIRFYLNSILLFYLLIVVVQYLSCVRLFETPWTAAHQASLSFTISWSLFKLMSIESVMSSIHFVICCPLLFPLIFPSIRVFSSESLQSGGQSLGASASVLPMNIQGWFPLGLTGLISLLSVGLSRVFSSTTVQKH